MYVIRGDRNGGGGCVPPGWTGWLTLYQCGANSRPPLGEMEEAEERQKEQ